jgi:hypothetical protein
MLSTWRKLLLQQRQQQTLEWLRGKLHLQKV